MKLPRYDPAQTYRWNYEHAPDPVEMDVPSVPGDWTFAGLPVASPLGIPAGPLLNGRWCLYYASLGFDVLTYKTVRSSARECYAMPNLMPVECGQLTGSETEVKASWSMRGSWAVSFGMPASSPDVWRRDVEWTRSKLPAGKLLNVSVVGTMQPSWSLAELAEDYAKCAKWAVESGADSVETNLSCPNVSTCDGQLYQNPDDAREIVQCVRSAIGTRPLITKIGHLPLATDAEELLESIGPFINAIAMTNSVATKVMGSDNKFLFRGQRRGICGAATRDASIAQTRMFASLVRKQMAGVQLIGCGGIEIAEHAMSYLASGAGAVHMATAAMTNPLVASEILCNLATNQEYIGAVASVSS